MHEKLVKILAAAAIKYRITGEESIPLKTLLNRTGYIAEFQDGQLGDLAMNVSALSGVPIYVTLPSADGKSDFRFRYENGIIVKKETHRPMKS